MPTPAPPADPSVGLGTKLGLTGVTGGVVAALVAVILGDRSEQTLGVLVGAGVTVVFGAVTIGGRMLQAALRERGRGDLADAIGELDLRVDQAVKTSHVAAERADSAHQRINLQLEDRNEDKQPSTGYLEYTGATIVGASFGDRRDDVLGDLPLGRDDQVVDELDDEDEPQPERILDPGTRAIDAPPVADVGDAEADRKESLKWTKDDGVRGAASEPIA